MKRTLALLLLLSASACKEAVHVDVQCVTTAAPAVECTLTQDKGKSEVETCFDFSATCDNGTLVKAPRTCGRVKDGGKAMVTITADQLTDVEKCGGSKPPTAKVENLSLKGV